MNGAKHITQSLLIMALALTTSCASLIRGKKPELVSQVKTAALVAYAVYQTEPQSVSFSLDSGKAEADSMGGKWNERAPHVNELYDDLQKALAKKMHWKLISKTAMLANAGYKNAHMKTMQGWQNKMPPSADQIQYGVENVLDSDALRILGAKGRADLRTALGVDAIIVAKIDVRLKASTIMGIGDRYPYAVLNLQVYGAGDDNAIWYDNNIEGAVSKISVGKLNIALDKNLLVAGAKESAHSAFEQIQP